MSPLEVVGISGPGINLKTAELLPGKLFLSVFGRYLELPLEDDQYELIVEFIRASHPESEPHDQTRPSQAVPEETPGEEDGNSGADEDDEAYDDYSDAWTGAQSI